MKNREKKHLFFDMDNVFRNFEYTFEKTLQTEHEQEASINNRSPFVVLIFVF